MIGDAALAGQRDGNGFDGLIIVDLPPGVEPQRFNTVIVWCETFKEFITAAQYR